MSFDLARSLRRIRPQRAAVIQRRALSQLPLARMPIAAGGELLIDTCVYIDVLQARAPEAVKALLLARIVNHSTLCLGELTHLFGRLDPADPGTASALREIRQAIEDVPGHRLAAPSKTAMGEAGMLAGLTARLIGAARSQAHTLFNDACIYLQALESGCTVLTRNTRDYDLFDQLLPAERVLFYERA